MAITKKRKKFFDVEIPILDKTTQLQGFEIQDLKKRFMKIDLTRILRGKSVEMQLKVSVKDNKATAKPQQIKILPYYLKRAVRKGTNYVENSFSAPCKDSVLKLKPFLIARRKVSRAVRKALREKAKDEFTKAVKTKTTDQIFNDILQNKLQKSVSLKLKKIYPLAFCDLRILKVEKELENKSAETKVKKETTEKKE